MSRPLPQYYRPYESDENEDFDSDDSLESVDSEDSENDPMTLRENDPRYAILKLAGPALHKNNNQIQYANKQHLGSPYDPMTNITSLEDHVYLDPPKTIKTTLISIKSINRDKSLFPTPYQFQLKLPRTYKNVTKFQLVQLSFPNNNTNNVSQMTLINSTVLTNLISLGVPSSCISDCVGLLQCTTPANAVALVEEGRINNHGDPLLVTLPVADGSYEDAELAREITFKANCTPPFNLITHESFRDIFMNTRDILCLFNEPGDGFYSKTNNKRYGTHSKMDIMNTYYSQYQVDIHPIITEKIAFNAYYFPVLKELLATQMGQPFLVLQGVTFTEVYSRVMGIFEGLDSDFYYTICQANKGTLDSYRRYHTFEFRNVNRYIVSHNSKESRYHILHDSLHTSILKDIQGRYQNVLHQQVTLQQLNIHSFRTLETEAKQYAAIYKHLESNLSTVMGQSFFVSGYKYDGGSEYKTNESTFTADVLERDPDFITLFSYTSSIGGLYGNYTGLRMSFESFSDYHSTLSSYYSIVKSTNTTLSTIYGSVDREYHRYVSTKYNRVLPARMIQSKSYTLCQGLAVSFLRGESVYIPGDSAKLAVSTMGNSIIYPHTSEMTLPVLPTPHTIPYDSNTCRAICCSTVRSILNTWYANLPASFVTRTTQYRLGLVNPTPSAPSSFNMVSTILAMTSTGNLNYLMQINDEQGFNNMDITMPENYRISNGTTGQVKLVCAKILMGQPGDTGGSQTVIQNPSIFDNTLGKLDRLDVKIYYDDQDITPAWQYQPFFMDLSEWNATFQVDEEVSNANRATGWGAKPTIPIPKNPDHMPYLAVTHRDNPNNS